MVAGINQNGTGRTFFSKVSNDEVFPKQVVLKLLFYGVDGYRATGRVNDTEAIFDLPTGAGPDRVYGLRKVGNQLEVRVNGARMMTPVPVVTPGASTENSEYLFLGVSGFEDPTWVDTLRAVILIRGPLGDLDVGALENHLLTAFNLI
jgi:hypothetical protein